MNNLDKTWHPKWRNPRSQANIYTAWPCWVSLSWLHLLCEEAFAMPELEDRAMVSFRLVWNQIISRLWSWRSCLYNIRQIAKMKSSGCFVSWRLKPHPKNSYRNPTYILQGIKRVCNKFNQMIIGSQIKIVHNPKTGLNMNIWRK